MTRAFVFLADGFEDVEALIPIDVLIRGGVEVVTVSIVEDTPVVESAHGVEMFTNAIFEDCDYDSEADLIILPGGMPGASNLYEHAGVREVVLKQCEAGKPVAAICAAPAVVLGQLGVLKGRKATCYPGFEQMLDGATYTGELCTVDGNIVTAEGPAAAFPFAFTLLAMLKGQEAADKVAEAMRYKHLMQR